MTASPGPEQGYWECAVHGRLDVLSMGKGSDDRPRHLRPDGVWCGHPVEWRAPEACPHCTDGVVSSGEGTSHYCPSCDRGRALGDLLLLSPDPSPRPAASSSLPPQDGERCENCGGSMASDGHDRIEFGGVPILMCPHARTDYREIFVTGGTTGGPAAELARLRTELAAAERKRDEQRALADGLARFAMQFESMARGIGGTRFETTGLLPLLARWRATRGEGNG